MGTSSVTAITGLQQFNPSADHQPGFYDGCDYHRLDPVRRIR